MPDHMSENEFRNSSGGGGGHGSLSGRRSNQILKKTVRFQVYNAINLTAIQEMRQKKLQELDRFSIERKL